MDDVYYQILRTARHETKVKGSRFIAECATVATVDEALSFLGAIRKREHAATHHCFAYTVGLFDDMQFKYSDDGEPSGTAGRPIYDMLGGQELSNCAVVVTRYFGGTKLGTGGLVRAYGDAARGALEAAGRASHYLLTTFAVEIDFPLYDLLTKAIHRHRARQVDARFTDRVNLEIEIRLAEADALQDEIVQLSGGKAIIERR